MSREEKRFFVNTLHSDSDLPPLIPPPNTDSDLPPLIPPPTLKPTPRKRKSTYYISLKNKKKTGYLEFIKIFKGATEDEFKTFAKLAKQKLKTLLVRQQVSTVMGYLYWDAATILKRITYIKDVEKIKKIISSWNDETSLEDKVSNQQVILKLRRSFIDKAIEFLDKYQDTLLNPPLLEAIEQTTQVSEKSISETPSKGEIKTANKKSSLEFVRKITGIKINEQEFNTLVCLSKYGQVGYEIRTDQLPGLTPVNRFYERNFTKKLISSLLDSITPERVNSLFPIVETEGPKSIFKKNAAKILQRFESYFLQKGWAKEEFDPKTWGIHNPYSHITDRHTALKEARTLRKKESQEKILRFKIVRQQNLYLAYPTALSRFFLLPMSALP